MRHWILPVTLALVFGACDDRDKNKQTAEDTPSKSPPVGTDDQPGGTFRALVTVCTKADGDGMWAMITPRFRDQLEQRAKALSQLGDEALVEHYGHTGGLATFDGKAFLSGSLKLTDEKFENPCWDAARWNLVEQAPVPEGFMGVFERSDKLMHGVRLKQHEGKWAVDDITKAQAPPK